MESDWKYEPINLKCGTCNTVKCIQVTRTRNNKLKLMSNNFRARESNMFNDRDTNRRETKPLLSRKNGSRHRARNVCFALRW